MRTAFQIWVVVMAAMFSGWLFAAQELENPGAMTLHALLARTRQLTQEEFELSKIAAQQAGEREVREFAQKAVKLGKELDEKLTELAAAEGVTEPRKISPSMQERLSAIQKIKGEAFDPDYLKMLIDLQTDNLQILEELAKRGSPKLRVFAKDAVATERAQRIAAQKLAAPEVPHVKPNSK